ncbi:MAG TPA: hypothetical protein DHW02_09760, partial [Ktedonobacter sp.]|nr:hypothetical protein [Ktedonobacter sp.]
KAGGLSVGEQLQVAQAIYESSPGGSAEQTEGTRLLIEMFKAGGLSVGEQIQVVQTIYRYSPGGSAELTFIVQQIVQLTQKQDIPVSERIQLAILPCTRYADNFSERLESVHMVLSLISPEDAKTFINEKWEGMPLSSQAITKDMLESPLSSLDIDPIYEMAKMDGLPDKVRDEMYALLNQIVAVRGVVENDEDEDD